MAVNIGINGFGRIGRYLVRLLAKDPELNVVVVNARADNEALARLLKYDSCHGKYDADVQATSNGFTVNGKQIAVTRYSKNEWQWGDYGVDIAVESTGTLKTRSDLAVHMEHGAKKTVISAPCADADLTVVMGVNDHLYDSAKHHVVSNASCTTNCLAPVVKVMHETFGIRHGLMTTVHSYTMSQRLLDGTHADPRRGRAAGMSMIPTSTGAAKAVGLVIPELAGKLSGMAIRVPTPNVSLVDLTCELESTTTAQELNAALKKAADTSLKDHMGYTEELLVSCDYMGSTFGGVVDGPCTSVVEGNMAKLIIWYDNESGFTNQLVRLLRKVAHAL